MSVTSWMDFMYGQAHREPMVPLFGVSPVNLIPSGEDWRGEIPHSDSRTTEGRAEPAHQKVWPRSDISSPRMNHASKTRESCGGSCPRLLEPLGDVIGRPERNVPARQVSKTSLVALNGSRFVRLLAVAHGPYLEVDSQVGCTPGRKYRDWLPSLPKTGVSARA
ncbi:hypothetical protein P170DRAFT_33609 [Aspergillus steynii IBT 23096]|uniref:Uncharacterized protein n=1 Tax=Aspergillus steynii IBT 23096 TaxID=1392250 RepID=A0A2I2GQJ0_9EURO|nr:uncharacterized protein P170DRAFT_33609 [Aspergillus steynii IBT 23096]PLB55148.1 hypothetical protein P170DRAFT_33609 [Aspergillus steynii IBT 23096]